MDKTPRTVALGRKTRKIEPIPTRSTWIANVEISDSPDKPFEITITANRTATLVSQRQADSLRLDAMIEHGLTISDACIGYGETVATHGVWTPDEDCLARAVDPREALDLAIAELKRKTQQVRCHRCHATDDIEIVPMGSMAKSTPVCPACLKISAEGTAQYWKDFRRRRWHDPRTWGSRG
jgi:hypothetical protein